MLLSKQCVLLECILEVFSIPLSPLGSLEQKVDCRIERLDMQLNHSVQYKYRYAYDVLEGVKVDSSVSEGVCGRPDLWREDAHGATVQITGSLSPRSLAVISGWPAI